MRFLKVSEDCGVVKQGPLIYDSHRLLRGKGKIGGVYLQPSERKKAAGRYRLHFLHMNNCSALQLSSAGFLVSGGETWDFLGSCNWDWFVAYPDAFVRM